MALKDILIHIDNTPSSPARLDLAIDLARNHNAHLKGMYVLSHAYYAPRQGVAATEAERKAHASFTEKTAQAGISAEWIYADWTVVGVSETAIINLYAYYTDLVIVGQPDHSSPDQSTPIDLPERLGLGTGCPLLVVPYTGTFAMTGHRVMIAWKPGRESARSTHDALPILEKANCVNVVTINSPGTSDEDNSAGKISTHLARHGLTVGQEQIQASPNLSVGDLLLNYACEQRMDLLVMGAYGQSRRGVFMLGPVARHLMNHMTLPILFSH